MYPCNRSRKWIKIDIDNSSDDITFKNFIIKCTKCDGYAFLHFIHDKDGDYYGPTIHSNCEGDYVYLCYKNKLHVFEENIE